MVVTWTTYNVTDSVVEYGMDDLSMVAKGYLTKFFDFNDTNIIWYIHRVTLKNLKPGITYSKCILVIKLYHRKY